MLKRKKLRQKGKIGLKKLFQEFKPGDRVTFIRELSLKGKPPKQFQGKTGVVVKKYGNAYIVRFLNAGVYKNLVIKPVHLRKLKS